MASRKTARQIGADDGDHADQDREQHDLAAGLSGEQERRGDRARSRHQRDRERKGRDVAHLLFERVLGLLRLPLDAHAEHHFGGDREQQQPAGDAEGRQRDAELVQQPVADKRGAGEDRDRR